MFLDKSDNAFIAFDKIGGDEIPVVVSVEVDFAQNQIGAVVRHRRENHAVLAQQKNAGQGDTAFAGFGIGLVDLGAF